MKGNLLIAGVLCSTVACTANISGGDGGGTTPVPGGSNAPPGVSGSGAADPASSAGGEADPNAAGTMPLRRLTRLEYDNTVADLLGDTSHPADDFPAETERQGNSPFVFPGDVDSLLASRFGDAAGALAASANLSRLLDCQPAENDEMTCATRFVEEFGSKAFRRPVTSEERERLLAVFRSARSVEELDFEGGLRALLEAMLQSPAFLYHWELGSAAPSMDGAWVRLGPYEVASRLSYFLWGSMPDDELFAAAASGKLSTAEEVRTQAVRLLGSDRARGSISAFVGQWLGFDQMADRSKDAEVYPEFDEELKAAMLSELQSLSLGVLLEGDGRLETLLTSNEASLSGPLAKIYGLDLAGASEREVELDPQERSGFLTRAGFQALFGGPQGSNPIKRGAEIYRRLLCGVIPPPPANVPPAKEAAEGGTTRMRFEEHSRNECAKGCHALFDSLGFAFEHYDGIGRYRTMDNGLPVDSSATLTLDGQQQSFVDGRELSELLAGSAEVKSCLTQQVATYGLARAVQPEDTFSLASAASAYQSGAGGIRELMATFAASRTFRYRKPASGEKLQ